MIAPTMEGRAATDIEGAGRITRRVVHVSRPSEAALTLAAIREVLARRPIAADSGICTDTCTACEAVKAKPFTCLDCGYAGRPNTLSCDCARGLEMQISFNAAALDRYATQEAWPADWRTTRADMLSEQTKLLRLPPIGPCRGHGRGQPRPRTRWGFLGNCSHSWTRCPACDGGHGDGEVESGPLLATLRDLRALVADGVEAPTIRSYRVKGTASDDDETAPLERELATQFRTPGAGGVCSLRLTENHDPDYLTGLVFLTVEHDRAPGDRHLSTAFSAAELDCFITHLTALRNAARDRGMVAYA